MSGVYKCKSNYTMQKTIFSSMCGMQIKFQVSSCRILVAARSVSIRHSFLTKRKLQERIAIPFNSKSKHVQQLYLKLLVLLEGEGTINLVAGKKKAKKKDSCLYTVNSQAKRWRTLTTTTFHVDIRKQPCLCRHFSHHRHKVFSQEVQSQTDI